MATVSALPPFTLPSSLLAPHSQQQLSLAANYKLLHLLHHRNKNQHRRSIWYRHFSLFRRQVKALCLDLGIDPGPGFKHHTAAHNNNTRKKPNAAASKSLRPRVRPHSAQNPAPRTPKQKQDTSRKASARAAAWLARGLVERWYTAFTTLLATPSAAPLALTVLGVLARVCALTGVTARIEAVAEWERAVAVQSQDRMMGDDGGEELAEGLAKFVEADLLPLGEGVSERTEEAGGEDDVGVAVARDDAGLLDSALRATNAQAGKAKETTTARARKKRKKGNAIDDLFAGIS